MDEDFEVEFDLGEFLKNADPRDQAAAKVSHPIASPQLPPPIDARAAAASSSVCAKRASSSTTGDDGENNVPKRSRAIEAGEDGMEDWSTDFSFGNNKVTSVFDDLDLDLDREKNLETLREVEDLGDESPAASKLPKLGYAIPGPAGAMQLGIEQAEPCLSSRNEDSFDAFADFRSPAWISALRYCRIGDSDPVKYSGPGSTISQIRSSSLGVDRIPQLLAIIESCTPNGCGDAFVTLKDPTGTIGGTIHKRLLAETEFGRDIVPQAVMLLCKVTVFRPSTRAQYLNITMHNVVQVFRK